MNRMKFLGTAALLSSSLSLSSGHRFLPSQRSFANRWKAKLVDIRGGTTEIDSADPKDFLRTNKVNLLEGEEEEDDDDEFYETQQDIIDDEEGNDEADFIEELEEEVMVNEQDEESYEEDGGDEFEENLNEDEEGFLHVQESREREVDVNDEQDDDGEVVMEEDEQEDENEDDMEGRGQEEDGQQHENDVDDIEEDGVDDVIDGASSTVSSESINDEEEEESVNIDGETEQLGDADEDKEVGEDCFEMVSDDPEEETSNELPAMEFDSVESNPTTQSKSNGRLSQEESDPTTVSGVLPDTAISEEGDSKASEWQPESSPAGVENEIHQFSTDDERFVDREELADAYDHIGSLDVIENEKLQNEEAVSTDQEMNTTPALNNFPEQFQTSPSGTSIPETTPQSALPTKVPIENTYRPTKVDLHTKRILVKVCGFKAREVARLKPEIALMIADQRLHRPEQGLCDSWCRNDVRLVFGIPVKSYGALRNAVGLTSAAGFIGLAIYGGADVGNMLPFFSTILRLSSQTAPSGESSAQSPTLSTEDIDVGSSVETSIQTASLSGNDTVEKPDDTPTDSNPLEHSKEHSGIIGLIKTRIQSTLKGPK